MLVLQIGNRRRWGRRRNWIAACIELYIDRESTLRATRGIEDGGSDGGGGDISGHGTGDAGSNAEASRVNVGGGAGGPRKSRRLSSR